MQGWECPKCGACYSPVTPACVHCVPMKYAPTSTEVSATVDGTAPGQPAPAPVDVAARAIAAIDDTFDGMAKAVSKGSSSYTTEFLHALLIEKVSLATRVESSDG